MYEEDETRKREYYLYDVGQLPLEIVVHIMNFLSLSDRQNAGLTCHLWYEASRDGQFLTKERVVIKQLNHDVTRPLKIFEASNTKFICFELQEVDFGYISTNFWEIYCPEMRSIHITDCDISSRALISILGGTHQLEYLGLENCRELFMSGRILDNTEQCKELGKKLQHLRYLSLAHNRYLSDNLFNRFVLIAPNLEGLSVMGCQVSFHPGLYKKFYPTDTIEMIGSESVLTFNNILRFIQSQASHLRRLNLSFTLLDTKALTHLVQVPNLCLKELNLENCDQLTNQGIVELARYQIYLSVLRLSRCIRLTDLALTAICDNLKQLRVLHLSGCRAITNASLPDLKKLEHLEELDLSHMEVPSESPVQGITEALCQRSNPKFRKLFVSALRLDEATLCALARCLPGLRFLDVSCCVQALTDRALQAICQHLVWLRTLRLCGCEKITDGGITGMGAGASSSSSNIDTASTFVVNKNAPGTSHNVHRIHLGSRAEEEIMEDARRKLEVKQLCEEQLLALESSGQSLPRIKGLIELDLSTCNRISDVSLKYSFSFPELRILNISRCQQISDVGLSYIGVNIPSIETMILAHCFNISDEGVSSLVLSLNRLRNLDLEGCTKLTDKTCEVINSAQSLSLVTLNINYCPGISMESAEECEKHVRLVQRTGLVPRDYVKCCTSLSKMTPPKPPPSLKGFKSFFRR